MASQGFGDGVTHDLGVDADMILGTDAATDADDAGRQSDDPHNDDSRDAAPAGTASCAARAQEGMHVASLRMRHWLSVRWVLVLVCCIVALTLEVFGFNHYFWSTMGYHSIDNPAATVEGKTLVYGKTYASTSSITVDIYPGGDADTFVDVDSIDLSVVMDVQDDGADVDMQSDRQCALLETMTVYDEGNSLGYSTDGDNSETIGTPSVSGVRSRLTCPAVPESMYRPLQSFGKVNHIELQLQNLASYTIVTFRSVTLNEHVPMRFDILRFLMYFLIFAAVACLLTRKETAMGEFVRGTPSESGGVGAASGRPRDVNAARTTRTQDAQAMTQRQELWFTLVMVAVILLIAFLQMNGVDDSDTDAEQYGYGNLAQSLLQGRLDLTVSTDTSELSSLSNPYDVTSRSAANVTYPWDAAYYGGRFYLYFGIVPALLLFVPFRMLFGADMPLNMAQTCIDAFIVIGTFLLVDELRRRYCPRMPWALFLLVSSVAAMAPSAILMVQRSAVYFVALGSGLAFVVWGLWLWVRSVRGVGADGSGLSVWRAAVGSLCMALAVGCRPTMALYSLLAFPVFWRVLRRPRANWWRVLAAVAPYVPVAAGLMWYNAARFGSPFEFGAKYQLTSVDVLHQGMQPSRIPLGLWYYLVNPVQFITEFPYTITTDVVTRHGSDMYTEPQMGGAFAVVPLLLVLFVPRVVRRARRSRGLRIWCEACAVAMASFDAMFGGIIMRYQLDLRLFLVIAAVAACMEWLQEASLREDSVAALRRYRIIAVLCIATLAMCFLTEFCPVDVSPLYAPKNQPLFWFRAWRFFDLVKL